MCTREPRHASFRSGLCLCFVHIVRAIVRAPFVVSSSFAKQINGARVFMRKNARLSDVGLPMSFFFCVVLSCVLFYPRDFPCWLTARAPRSTATGCVRRPPSARTKPLKRHQIKRVDAAAQNKWCWKSRRPEKKM